MRIVTCLAALVGAVSCTSSATVADAPAASVPPPASISAPASARTADEERVANEAAYQFLYLPERASVVAAHSGGWLAIVDRRVVPAIGARPAPTKTMEEAVAAARAAAPNAKHRFIFQVGVRRGAGVGSIA